MFDKIHTTANNVHTVLVDPTMATKVCTLLCSVSVNIGFRHWRPQPSRLGYQLETIEVATRGGIQRDEVLYLTYSISF
jgi:hypothetical protein